MLRQAPRQGADGAVGPMNRINGSPSAIARAIVLGIALIALPAGALAADPAPVPLLAKEKPVDWWFVFKFNASKFAGCGKDVPGDRDCRFGGAPRTRDNFGQQFAFASSANGELVSGKDCVGTTTEDPVGATFDQVYNGSFNYLLWNDQFYGDPKGVVCSSGQCAGRWGHSKGMLAWNDAGEGFVMQVSTPGWPRAGSNLFAKRSPNMGNTLGCSSSNNNLLASQHFFALRLDKNDLIAVLKALENASVVTDRKNLQIIKAGGPQEVKDQIARLGEISDSVTATKVELSSKVILISKPSHLEVPPWQMVSALLGNVGERAATWWLKPWINSTARNTEIECWDKQQLGAKPGPVTIVGTGEWMKQEFSLTATANHAKIGVTTSGDKHYAIFGDLNQQGTIAPPGKCNASQNGRGGLFFVVENKELFDSVSALIGGKDAPPKK
ncbi:MAG: hypothetical protein QOG38_2994 [Hyphomicrobiales bacterium]|jgi:hypothetical protein|nr:hypothetical protein [Hyphomicrobiales bacterium]